MENKLPYFIVNGVCENQGNVKCNLGYACDGCPYNKDQDTSECYCCKKTKPIILIDKRHVCNSCNHLRPSLQGKPNSIKLGEK